MTTASSIPPSLAGSVIESEAHPGVRYELERLVGEGGMGFAYLARREGPEGSAFVVIKFMRPDFAGGDIPPELVAMKEAVALGRLNERLPPTPYVVRLVDAGSARILGAASMPWTAIEYVHGGIEGTTLEDRVTHSVHTTGFAFDVPRAAHAIRCLGSGLDAIHSVSVLHRDFSPGNVLCCGFGESEIFKIADLGVARAAGIGRSFVGLSLGTLGYSAPESMSINAAPHTDVFSFACVVYYLLTGQHYFEVSTPKEAFDAFASEFRPSISDHEWLTPELSADPAMCREIDRLLALSTALEPSRRPQTAPHLTELLLEALGEQTPVPSSSVARLSALFGAKPLSHQQTFRFLVRSRPHDGVVIASAAWNSDAHALALSERGAWFWNGQAWRDARSLFARLPRLPTCAAPHDAGGWLISGSGPGLWLLDERGLCDWLRAPAEEMSLCLACGRADELLAAVDVGGQSLALVGVSRGHWLFPRSLPGVARVTALRRLDADRFLCGGRRKDGSGFAAVYTPLSAEVVELESPELRAFIDVATVPERGAGLLVGSDGVTLRLEQALESAIVPGRPDLSAAAIDLVGGEWAATSGKLFRRNPDQGEPWRAVFEDPSLSTPFISILADAGYVIATTADGAIVEGRLE